MSERDGEPRVLSVERDARSARITLIAQQELHWFDGHFPQAPLLPGVVQTHWAIGFGRAHLDVRGAFRELKNVKFIRVIQPGDRLTLHLEHDPARGELSFEYRSNDAICSAGVASFAA